YREARRVLKPRGHFFFNVWDRISENEFADVVTQALATLFPQDPPRFMARIPHGYHDVEKIREELVAAGFKEISIETVDGKAAPLRHAILRLPTAKELRCGTKSRPVMRRAWKVPRPRRRKPSGVALERGRSKAASGRT